MKARYLAALSIISAISFSSVAMAGTATGGLVSFGTQTIAGYTLSGIMVDPDMPYMDCSISGPPDTAAKVTITVFFYDSVGSNSFPYAHATAGLSVSPNASQICGVNNGPQPVGPHQPLKRIQIQVTAAEPTVSGVVYAMAK